MTKWILGGIALVIAGTGLLAVGWFQGLDEQALQAVPADAVVVGDFDIIDFVADFDLLTTLLDPDEFLPVDTGIDELTPEEEEVRELIDETATWIAGSAAFWVNPSELDEGGVDAGCVLASTRDKDAADQAMDSMVERNESDVKREDLDDGYRYVDSNGETIGRVDNVVFFCTDVAATDASVAAMSGENILDVDRYNEMIDKLGEGQLHLWVDVAYLTEAISDEDLADLPEQTQDMILGLTNVGAVGDIGPDQMTFSFTALADEGTFEPGATDPSSLAGQLPADTLAATFFQLSPTWVEAMHEGADEGAAGQLGTGDPEELAAVHDIIDLFGNPGSFAVTEGEGIISEFTGVDIDVQLLFGTDDAAAVSQEVLAAMPYLGLSSTELPAEDFDGVPVSEVGFLDITFAHWAQREASVVLGTSAERAANPGDDVLADSARFVEITGHLAEDVEPRIYLDMAAIYQFVIDNDIEDGASTEEGEDLDNLDFVIAGTKSSSSEFTWAVTVGFREGA